MSHGPLSQTTTLETLMSLIKVFIGTGILSMPFAFNEAGYVTGIVGIIVIGTLCNCCIHMLIEINDKIVMSPDQPPYDYIELAELAFDYGPKKLKKYAKLSRAILGISLCATQLGFCCAYALFVSENLLHFAINVGLVGWTSDDVIYVLLMLLPLLILLNFVKNMKHLAIGSMFANLIQWTSLIIIIYNLVSDIPPLSERKPFNTKVPQFISTTFFTFEGITMAMPLYRSIKDRSKFGSPFGVVNAAIVFVIITYCSIGFFGYLKYGSKVEPSITLSLPDEMLYEAVRLMYAAAITFSHPLQMFVAINMIWPPVKKYLSKKQLSESCINIWDYITRALLVTLTFAAAATIPELDLIIELIGALTCSTVGVIIPSVLHLVSFYDSRHGYAKVWLYTKDLFLLGCGVFACIAGTYYSILGIWNRLGGTEECLVVTTATTMIMNITKASTTTEMPLWFDRLFYAANLTTFETNGTNLTSNWTSL